LYIAASSLFDGCGLRIRSPQRLQRTMGVVLCVNW
jgi:hypothetical protein